VVTRTRRTTLGVGIDAASQTTRSDHPGESPAGSSSEQAGPWFGTDGDNRQARRAVVAAGQGSALPRGGRRAGHQVRLREPQPRERPGHLELGCRRQAGPRRRATGSATAARRACERSILPSSSASAPPASTSADRDQELRDLRHAPPGSGAAHLRVRQLEVEGVGRWAISGIAFDRRPSRSSARPPWPSVPTVGSTSRRCSHDHAFTLGPDHLPVADQVITTLGSRLTLDASIPPRPEQRRAVGLAPSRRSTTESRTPGW
jgi:hypothetical protein